MSPDAAADQGAARGCATLPAANWFRGLAEFDESGLRLKGFN
jgi:hypothetical protein